MFKFRVGRVWAIILSIFSVFLLCFKTSAGDLDVSLDVSTELRVFFDEPLFPEQLTRYQPSIAFNSELDWNSENQKHQIVISPFYRIDGSDEDRTHFDFREAYYKNYMTDELSLSIGLLRVFWGKTESHHLIDILNQTDTLEDVDREDKLGAPAVNLTYASDIGTFDIYLSSFFREVNFPSQSGRLRLGAPVNEDRTQYSSSQGRKALDYVIRYENSLDKWDIGAYAFRGTSRDPRLIFEAESQSFIPLYDRISQFGVEAQYTHDAWLIKNESLYRKAPSDSFFATVIGLERTFYQVFDKSWDVGLVFEYQYDGRNQNRTLSPLGPTTFSPVTINDNDVFMGSRIAFNDTQSAELLVGATIDLDNSEQILIVEAKRRMSSSVTVAFEVRAFKNIKPKSNLIDFKNDSFVNLKLTKFF